MNIFGVAGLILSVCCCLVAKTDGDVIRLTIEQVHTGLASNSFDAVVDVRTIGEWNDNGHLPNATLVDPMDLPDPLEGCEKCSIVVYCHSGQRAQMAAEMLIASGFEGPVYNGLGISQWAAAGFELVTGESLDPPPCACKSCASAQCHQESMLVEDAVEAANKPLENAEQNGELLGAIEVSEATITKEAVPAVTTTATKLESNPDTSTVAISAAVRGGSSSSGFGAELPPARGFLAGGLLLVVGGVALLTVLARFRGSSQYELVEGRGRRE